MAKGNIGGVQRHLSVLAVSQVFGAFDETMGHGIIHGYWSNLGVVVGPILGDLGGRGRAGQHALLKMVSRNRSTVPLRFFDFGGMHYIHCNFCKGRREDVDLECKRDGPFLSLKHNSRQHIRPSHFLLGP
jgi:hypothetical protein